MKLALAILCLPLVHATTVDRIAAVVAKHAIKTSDIDRDLRVTQFLNGEPADSSEPARKKSLDRLIDQQLIRADMEAASNTAPLEADASTLEAQIVRDRFRGSKALMLAELQRRGLDEAQLVQSLQWQLLVLRFIDQRFRAGIIVTDDQIAAYYAEHRAAADTLESATPAIREMLEAEEVNKNFDEWLMETRMSARIEYKGESKP